MVFKEATDCCPGCAAIYGAPDLVKVMQLLNGNAITGCCPVIPRDTIFTISDATDATALIRFDATAITTCMTRVVTVPDFDLILVGTVACQTLTCKTLTTPTIVATGFTNMNHTHIGATTGGTITEASISDLQCYITTFDPTGSPLLDARFWLGNACNVAVELTVSGGVTVANTGVATVVTNANLTGDVTSTGNATTIACSVVDVSMLSNGTDGELITWNACAVAATVGAGTCGQFLQSQGAGCVPIFATLPNPTESFMIAASDETTALTCGVKITWHMPYAFTLTDIKGSLTTASCCGVVTVDVHEGATTIMTCCKVQFDACEDTTETAACPPVLTDTALADNAVMTIIVDAPGMCAAGLKVTLIGTRT